MKKCENCNNEMSYVKKIMANGRYHVQRQCFVCGKDDTENQKFSVVENYLLLPDFDIEFRNRYREQEREKQRAKRQIEKMEEQKQRKEDYDAYLNSEEWRNTRMLAFYAYGDTCYCCGKAPATDVHHLHYANFKNETENDIVPLCRSCHELLHSEEYPALRIFVDSTDIYEHPAFISFWRKNFIKNAIDFKPHIVSDENNIDIHFEDKWYSFTAENINCIQNTIEITNFYKL